MRLPKIAFGVTVLTGAFIYFALSGFPLPVMSYVKAIPKGWHTDAMGTPFVRLYLTNATPYRNSRFPVASRYILASVKYEDDSGIWHSTRSAHSRESWDFDGVIESVTIPYKARRCMITIQKPYQRELRFLGAKLPLPGKHYIIYTTEELVPPFRF